MCRELVANWSRRFQTCLKILCEFVRQNISQDCRATVMRRSCDVRASVANLSPQNCGVFTMPNSRETHTNVVRVSYDGRAIFLRKHANTSRLSGEKINLSDIRTNVV